VSPNSSLVVSKLILLINATSLIRYTVCFPLDPLGWLYCARGFYKLKQYHQAIECLTPALRNDRTKREAQHLLAFSFMHTGQNEAALGAFYKSVIIGNDTDWQCLVEILLDNPVRCSSGFRFT
jgi:tetratricopeptide (TPR) repeat protein